MFSYTAIVGSGLGGRGGSYCAGTGRRQAYAGSCDGRDERLVTVGDTAARRLTRFATHGENCAERESSPVVVLATAAVFRIMTRHVLVLVVAVVWPMSSVAEIGKSIWGCRKSVLLNCARDPGPFVPAPSEEHWPHGTRVEVWTAVFDIYLSYTHIG